MKNQTFNDNDIEEKTSRLSISILNNYRAGESFDRHLEYNNFKLNDSIYLDALGKLHDNKDFMYIVNQFMMHYSNELDTPASQEQFIKYTSSGHSENVKIFKELPISFYFGLKTTCPEAFIKPEAYYHLNRDIKYGLAMNYYLKYEKFINDDLTYINLIHTYNESLLKSALKDKGTYKKFHSHLNSLIYTKDIQNIPSYYINQILDSIQPNELTNDQKAQYMKNIYMYFSHLDIRKLSLVGIIQYMNEFCSDITEWPSLKKQILALNPLTLTTFEHKEIVASLLTKIDNNINLPEIDFNT